MAHKDYHTIVGWQSEQDFYEEYQRDKAEAEYFAHVEGLPTATHDYPLVGQNAIMMFNESLSQECPF